MGKRKLRYDVRKNYERKMEKSCKTVSCCEEQFSEELVVRVPVTLYTSSSAPDILGLNERLLESRCLPADWTCSDASAVSLSLRKLQPMESADVVYVVTICSDFTWRVSIGQKHVPIHESALLHNAPHLLNNVQSVVGVLSLLDGCKSEQQLLIEKHNGNFMADHSGNL